MHHFIFFVVTVHFLRYVFESVIDSRYNQSCPVFHCFSPKLQTPDNMPSNTFELHVTRAILTLSVMHTYSSHAPRLASREELLHIVTVLYDVKTHGWGGVIAKYYSPTNSVKRSSEVTMEIMSLKWMLCQQLL